MATTAPTYNVVDEKALFDAHPKFFKLDHSKVRKAIALDLELPGIEVAEEVISAPAKKAATRKKSKVAA